MSKQDTRTEPLRRRYTAMFKRELVERSLQPGASVSGIALENGINANGAVQVAARTYTRRSERAEREH